MLVPPAPPPAGKPITMFDVECYVNYFLVKVRDRKTGHMISFEFSVRKRFNWVALRTIMSYSINVGFNSLKYDILMISAAATGRFTNAMLKRLSDAIINGYQRPNGEFIKKTQPWMVAMDFGFELLEFDHIDLIEVAPGDGSLKIYGGRVHSKKMQDLPYPHDSVLTYEQMDNVDAYCGNDLVTTDDLYTAVEDDIATRDELTTQYGMDMRSKSDAQIAEAAFIKLLGYTPAEVKAKKAAAQLPVGTQLRYTPAPFLQFRTAVMQQAFAMICSLPFVILANGQPEMPEALKGFTITFDGSSVYALGIGGLHSTEQRAAHRADANTKLVDVDVVSYYPKIISILRMFPHQIGEVFLTIYDGWIEVRIDYKNKGNKKKAATFKIKINGTFGKTGSKYSILYTPEMMIRTTVTGQLSLLMLIEMLYLQGISVVSANTDGVVIKCTPAQEATRDAVVREWERLTGFETEANAYIALFSRDINNYLAFKPAYTDKKGVYHPIEAKSKGAYADPGLQKNPTNIICVDAVKEYLINGTLLQRTIRQCDDIRKFVTVRGVQGGGEWVLTEVPDMKATQKIKKERISQWGFVASPYPNEKNMWGKAKHLDTMLWHAVALDAAYQSCFAQAERVYLGKAVRWYYGRGQKGHIAYVKNGNLVARSEGAKPCMDLPDVLPSDIDYDWYIKEAQSLLHDLGIC